VSLPQIIHGQGADLFDVSGTSQPDDVVLFLYIDFTVNQRDIRGYIALLMDLSSLESLRDLLRGFIQRMSGESTALSHATP
jgi:chemotaxis protein CheC